MPSRPLALLAPAWLSLCFGLSVRSASRLSALPLLPSISPTPRCPPTRMLRDSYDVIVIGGGPVGITAALRAAKLGHSAIVIDATPPSQFQFTGPTGLYSKALRDAALRIDVGVLRKMGIGDAACWAQISELVDSIRMKAGDTNAEGLSVSRIPHLRGRGSLLPSDGDELKVKVAFNEQRSDTVGGGNVILATGSKAVRLDHLGEAYTTLITHRPFPAELRVFDSDSIKLLSFLPRSVTIVGGGIIAVEFARIFAALGAKVTMCVRASDLPSSLARVGIDRELASALQRDLQAWDRLPSLPSAPLPPIFVSLCWITLSDLRKSHLTVRVCLLCCKHSHLSQAASSL